MTTTLVRWKVEDTCLVWCVLVWSGCVPFGLVWCGVVACTVWNGQVTCDRFPVELTEVVSSTCSKAPVFWGGGVKRDVGFVMWLVLNEHAEGCIGTHSVTIGVAHLRCKHCTRSPIDVLLSL